MSFTPSSDAAWVIVWSCCCAPSEKSGASPRSSIAWCAMSCSRSRCVHPGSRFGIQRETLPSARMDLVVSRAGDRALLVDLGADVAAATLHAAAAAARTQPGVAACVVGHQTLYVVFGDSLAVDRWQLADSVVRPTA